MLRLALIVLALASLVTAAWAQHYYYDEYGRPYATTQEPPPGPSYREIIPNQGVTNGLGLYEPQPPRCYTQYYPGIGGIGASSSTRCY